MSQPAATMAALPGKWSAAGFSLVVTLAVLSPIVQNWRPDPVDSFPLSYYPMFANGRSTIRSLTYLVGLDDQAQRVSIPYTFAGTGGMNQVRRQINSIVSRNEAPQLCRMVSSRVAQRRSGPAAEVMMVAIVTGRYDLDRYFTNDKNALSEQIRATCPVTRRS